MVGYFYTPISGAQWTEEELTQIKAGKQPIPYDDRARQPHDIDLPKTEYQRLNFGKLD
jgi:hypothetical protein